MYVNYLTSVPPPAMNQTDALYNEITYLRRHIGGEFMSFYTAPKRGFNWPWQLTAFPHLLKIKAAERRSDLHHIYTPKLTPFPFLFALSKPIILSVVGNLSEGIPIPSPIRLRPIDKIVVSNERDLAFLHQQNIKNGVIIRTGIPQSHLTTQQLPLTNKLVLLMASAPWNMEQFDTKGIRLILQALQQSDDVKIIFIWRAYKAAYMRQLIQEYGVSEKVELVNEHVVISDYLERVHGALLLCNKGGVIKSYPHSLLETLAVSKPIITSKIIPIADFIQAHRCGLVLPNFSVPKLLDCFRQFRNQYTELAAKTQQLDKSLFSIDNMVMDYQSLYEQVTKGKY